jgi:hypothetical protein
VDRRQAFDLADLEFHWGEVYKIKFEVKRKTWTAARFGDLDHVLTAESATDLRQMIRDDYAEWTTPKTGEGRLNIRADYNADAHSVATSLAWPYGQERSST